MNLVTRLAVHEFGHIHALNWARRIGLAREHFGKYIGLYSGDLALASAIAQASRPDHPMQAARLASRRARTFFGSQFLTNTIPLIDDIVAINLTNISVARKRLTA